jgi:hypothetical protein
MCYTDVLCFHVFCPPSHQFAPLLPSPRHSKVQRATGMEVVFHVVARYEIHRWSRVHIFLVGSPLNLYPFLCLVPSSSSDNSTTLFSSSPRSDLAAPLKLPPYLPVGDDPWIPTLRYIWAQLFRLNFEFLLTSLPPSKVNPKIRLPPAFFLGYVTWDVAVVNGGPVYLSIIEKFVPPVKPHTYLRGILFFLGS